MVGRPGRRCRRGNCMIAGRTIALLAIALLAVSACTQPSASSSPSVHHGSSVLVPTTASTAPSTDLSGSPPGGELPFAVVVSSAGSGMFGGPAAALTLDQLRRVITTRTEAPGNFQCVNARCLPTHVPSNSLLVVLTPSPAACDPVTAFHARLTGAHTLTITADLSIDCRGDVAAQSAAMLLAVPLSSLPSGALTVVAPGPRAVPASTTVTLP
jgi:hypothetical protein